MNTATKAGKRRQPERTVCLELAPFGPNPGVLAITVGKDTTRYWLRRLAGDFGDAFEVEKFASAGGETYHVSLGEDETESSCECNGFVHHGHCKHVSGLLALRQAGKL
jgi:hypothetical protein